MPEVENVAWTCTETRQRRRNSLPDGVRTFAEYRGVQISL